MGVPAGGTPKLLLGGDGVKLPPGVVVAGPVGKLPDAPGARLGRVSAGTIMVVPERVGGGGTVGVPMIGERIEGIVAAGAGTVGITFAGTPG